MSESEHSPGSTSRTDDIAKYQRIRSFIDSMKEKGVQLDRVVVPSEDLQAVKERAATDESGALPKTTIRGVTITYLGRLNSPEARIKIGTEEESE